MPGVGFWTLHTCAHIETLRQRVNSTSDCNERETSYISTVTQRTLKKVEMDRDGRDSVCLPYAFSLNQTLNSLVRLYSLSGMK